MRETRKNIGWALILYSLLAMWWGMALWLSALVAALVYGNHEITLKFNVFHEHIPELIFVSLSMPVYTWTVVKIIKKM